MIRIGSGFDAHRLVEGRPLILGGVTLDFHMGLLGHSDGDALTHAVCDAILGAAALGDLGRHYKDTDPEYKDISSLLLLKDTGEKLKKAGYRVVNLDATIIAEAPKIAPHSQTMARNLATALDIDPDRVSIKATTTEKLGFTGRGEGIAAFCSVLIESV
ncbi:2-C-methyl-D-erythritol 2,4-cyclodiphosphate synthase [hydrothermal vent metagenome]|uniref:2-C-methyl-D-erythritol 2,4-cyclodiphosphate synthase n=1 Tax=hydrothermal vent metagenome TaxID=652676 RepID=A0A3B1BRI1_9ZZZZ